MTPWCPSIFLELLSFFRNFHRSKMNSASLHLHCHCNYVLSFCACTNQSPNLEMPAPSIRLSLHIHYLLMLCWLQLLKFPKAVSTPHYGLVWSQLSSAFDQTITKVSTGVSAHRLISSNLCSIQLPPLKNECDYLTPLNISLSSHHLEDTIKTN